ncbi:helix-turn-helix domain-containing protein [Nocardia heshunensis]
MSYRTSQRPIGIGELARRTGVPVRTIRFYCDEGVLAAGRSSGGHRMFDPDEAVERLVLVRRMRGLGLGLGSIAAVLAGERTMAEAVAAERGSVDAELGALARRRDALLAVEDPRRGYRTVLDFWARLLAPLSPQVFEAFAEMDVPNPVCDWDPGRVLAFGELAATIADPEVGAVMARQLWRADPGAIRHPRALLNGVAEACQEIGGLLLANESPRPGPELDRFVAAHASGRGVRDTPGFRRRLVADAVDSDPRVRRYWSLTGEITGTITSGGAQHWLARALAESSC